MTSRLSQVVLDDAGSAPLSPEADQERRVAIFDLVEEGRFEPVGSTGDGPWTLVLSIDGGRALFDLSGEDGGKAQDFALPLAPLRQAMKDYAAICEAYSDAVRHLPPGRIAELDEARRAIHEEGARDMGRRLRDHVHMDDATAKRLFTLICLSVRQTD